MPTLMLIDGHALAYRAFHAIPPLTTPAGELVNAVYGFTRILLTVIKDLSPEYLAVSFDLPEATFRHTAYTNYKAQRKEMPNELITQIERIKTVVATLNIPIFAVPGYEADDIIGTIATIATQPKGNKVIIVTGDRDAFQLVSDVIHVYMPPRGKDAFSTEFGPQEVEEKVGIRPDQIVDYKGLAGDASDNIPGIPGIGDKTAVRLLQAFGSADAIFAHFKDFAHLTDAQRVLLKPKLIENLSVGYESFVLSRQLATIDREVPLSFNFPDCVVKDYDKTKITALFDTLGFKSLHSLLPNDHYEDSIQQALF